MPDPRPLDVPLETEHAELRARYRRAAESARQECEQRRARVLAHPDLAERVRAVLQLDKASQWNGYVPPRSDAEEACRECVDCECTTRCKCHVRTDGTHYSRINGSWRRQALVDICAEADRREQEGNDDDEPF